MIGDQRTAALVAIDGTIDFWCAPDFDSASVFASLLDADRGGRFVVAPVGGGPAAQRYVRDTNVLVTTFSVGAAIIELVDFMPMERSPSTSRIVRLATVRGGEATLRMRCAPRFDYARMAHATTIDGNTAELLGTSGQRLRLTTSAPLGTEAGDVVAEIRLQPGEHALIVLEQADESQPRRWNLWRAKRALRRTIVHWRRWTGGCSYRGPFSGEVRRSALVLALLHSRRTGAVIAAPTFGLPEQIGGERNWDFRFSWIRDASFIVSALTRLGLRLPGTSFASWIGERCAAADHAGELQSMYGFDGRTVLTEQTLDHLEGYRASRPVRVGNAAYAQFQLDVYGELLDALYIEDLHHQGTSRSLWTHVVELVNWVCANWTRPDQGIWEVRSGPQQFLYSRVMCWVAMDRAIRLGRRRGFAAPFAQWRKTREAIRRDIETSFWNEDLGFFVGSMGSRAVDAASLIMPLVRFIQPTDPRWLGTLAEIERRLVRDGLVRRYDLTGMDTDAGAAGAPSFTICSFWYVECLARMGRVDEARRAMTRLLACANHLGLFSEDMSSGGELLGNFPQGLTHLALIGAALAQG